MKPFSAVERRFAVHALVAGVALLAVGAASPREHISDDFRCLTSDGVKPIHLEFRMFSDPSSNWSGGYVKYKGAKKVIPVVPGKTETLDKPEGRPWVFRTTWHEVVEGKFTGDYFVTTQGANIYGFTYRNAQTGKAFEFSQDIESTGELACDWQ